MATITKKKTETKADQILSRPYVLILENDDYNSFDHVINCLMRICNHELEQATQCSFIVHHKGKCDVKYGNYETISIMKEKLQSAGLSVTMEVNG
jgi:ATP-dependent Clp protease adaptor protein ClpS